MKLATAHDLHMRKLLFKCILCSLAVHLFSLTVLYLNPLILHNPLGSLFGISSATPGWIGLDENSERSADKNALLQEVFQQIVLLSPHLQQPFDLTELPRGLAIAPNSEEIDTHCALEHSPFLEPTDETLFSLSPPQLPIDNERATADPLFYTTKEYTPIASQLQIDSPSLMQHIDTASLPSTHDTPYDDFIAASDPVIIADLETVNAVSPAPYISATLEAPALKMEPQLRSGSLRAPLDDAAAESNLFTPPMREKALAQGELHIGQRSHSLDHYAFPETSLAAAWNDDFDVDVVFLPNPDGDGYIFSLAMSANGEISDYSIKQILYFVIDRSTSVQRHRFAVFKRAVMKALSSMDRGDTFNIFVVDTKTVRFKPESLSATQKNIQAAEAFLDKQESGGLFTSGEIYTSIEKVLTSVPDNDEMHTVILLTDGKTDLNATRRQKGLKSWIEKNKKKASLYAAAVGRDNDLVNLDLLCSVSGGKLLYSDTHASLPRKLAKLVLDLKAPIAKDILMTAVPHNPRSHVEFSSVGSHLPALFSHQPYVVYGQIDEPCSFDLVLQGRHRDQWIAIKKVVNFIDGKKGDKTLEANWKAQQANRCYAKFLKKGNVAVLKEARKILKKARTDVAFE
ncbi:MAG: VWA domain-containing protein [Chlamydiota bacterium]